MERPRTAIADLPPELLDIIQNGSHEQCLFALTETAQDSRYTYPLLAHFEDIFAHICASVRSQSSFAASIAFLGRVVPFAPFLAPFATQVLENERYVFGSDEDSLYLLGLFRLLQFDHLKFKKYVRTQELLAILPAARNQPTTYLVIRILKIVLHGADHWLESTLLRYLGPDSPDRPIHGVWDDREIDYRFLSLWEEGRFEEVTKQFSTSRETILATGKKSRSIPPSLFHPSTRLVGCVLLPARQPHTLSSPTQENELVCTDTVSKNLNFLGSALKSRSPLLLSGLAGSGKTLLVQHAARLLGKLEALVTLHLNEQSDAKLLLGVYTTGNTPGTFSWKPGVLTTAVIEGRWVLIEDLDRAPNDVLGTLLPLIERGELLIPNRKETIYAAEGFRILATVRSSVNHRGDESKPLTHMLGFRHWQVVPVAMPAIAEHAVIMKTVFPNLADLLPQFTAVYERLTAERQRSILVGQSKTGVARIISPRDLLKWCKRVSSMLKSRTSFTSTEGDHIFLEAVDCFIGSLPDGNVRDHLTDIIAEELRIDPQRAQYLLKRDTVYEAKKDRVIVGRHEFTRAKHIRSSDTSFSTNPHTTRMLERVGSAVVNREPLLLVGETGVGKTTAVQHLAQSLGKKLVPFNLSQQSEAGDLLGGFKPVNARTLMVPIKDEFDELFANSFSLKKNQQFVGAMGKQMAKSNWKAVCKLWRHAMSMVEAQQNVSTSPREGEGPTKKRKTDPQSTIDFARWDEFAEKVQLMERTIASGSSAFAFSFVEGNIVKAVRAGDWVLLDEINLASPDTLESITDLLDPSSPSLLLTEAGNIERIKAHPNFRVFAAMNPATDVGKKDLPPGIRSRFTELYVESPDKDFRSLQSIVCAYLRHETEADPKLAPDVSTLYQEIIALADANRLVDGAGQKPHFSLRTLTRTLSYAKHIQQICSLRRALYEGFQMSFLTFLDTESVALVQPMIEKHLFDKKKTNVKSELKKLMRQPDDGHTYVHGHPKSKHWIRKGANPVQDQPQYIITPFVERNLENLVRAASTRQFPVLIQGPTSAGKTSMIEYLANRTGHQFTRINNHDHTDLQEYLGTYVSGTDGRLQFQEGVLVKALREGHWIVLDELNLAPTDVLEALNRLLDDNRELLIPETQEVVRPHSDFMLFATQNPAGIYGGRKNLSRAFRNRFLELHFDDIPVNELEEILHKRTQLPESRCRRVVAVYREVSRLRQENRLFEQKSFATLRDLFRWALRPNDTIEHLAANGFMLLCERVRKSEERIALKAIIEQEMSKNGPRVKIDEDLLYSEQCEEVQKHKANASDHSVVWTKAMRRLYVLVSRATENNEPVLLVGETGCGKTTVCQMLSDALKRRLHMVNAHQNTETGDLIGSQRPVRNRASIEASLRQDLLSSECMQLDMDAVSLSTESLLVLYDQKVAEMAKEDRTKYFQSSGHLQIQTGRTRFKALFEWSDGSLVEAMRNGELFLLDEISLADDSVLERINSVLESSRSILLAEKGSLDSQVIAAEGFQFFATMNPGGDYGKRELSPALRNRFTEIWVPAMSDTDDILQIVQSKLAAPAQPQASAMIAFAGWFKARFDTSASSSVSIRDTLAWVQFINAFAHAAVLPSIVHGAAMVYIDTLGANPAGLMSVASQDLNLEREVCIDQLSNCLSIDARSIYQQSFAVQIDDAAFGIGPFQIPRQQNTSTADAGFTFDPPTTRINAMRVLRALQLRKPVMLEGSPGVGKTALITAIANAVSVPLTRINLSDQTDLLDLFGSDAPVEGAQEGTFVWRDAPFLRAMKNGEWVLLDEMNLASQSVLEGLNACLDHRGEVFVPELGQSFSRHPSFRLFAAQNPHHQGGGRKGLPASFVNRFTVVYAASLQAADFTMICEGMFPNLDRKYIQKAVTFVSSLNEEVANRRRFGASGGPWEFNLRDISRWLCLASSKEGLLPAGSPRDFVAMLFSQRFRTPLDETSLEALFHSVFQDAQPAADLFCNVSTQTLQVGLGLLPRDTLFATSRVSYTNLHTKRHLRTVQSMMLSVRQSWPVILTGSPGVGKTILVERLAAAVGATIVTLGMSAETDALDLIGGYEQYDPHRQTAEALTVLRAKVEPLCKMAVVEGSADSAAKLRSALERLESDPTNAENTSSLADLLPAHVRKELSPTLATLQSSTEAIDKARFVWIDGALIEALQHGKWLVLDNANLCSPSVLDRLNGLMEPNGVLVVNERSEADGSARIIKPHPGFRVFMTTDPRMGELSRAMRNRAVEIYLPTPDSTAAASTDGLHSESAMARFKLVKSSMTSSAGEIVEQRCIVAHDHLGVGESALAHRFAHQLPNGLIKGSASLIDTLALTNTSSYASSELLQVLYASSIPQTPADFAHVQTLHPLNNQALVQVSQRVFQLSLSLALQHDLGTSLSSLVKAISSARCNRKLNDRLASFWKSVRQQLNWTSVQKSGPLGVVEKLALTLSAGLVVADGLSTMEIRRLRMALNGLLSFCWTLLHMLTSEALELPLLTATSLVGQSVTAIALSKAPAASCDILAEFKNCIGELGVASDTQARHAFVALWKTFLPNMPATMDALEAGLILERIVAQFDQATSKFHLPVPHVVELRVAFQRSLDLSTSSATDLRDLTNRVLAAMPESSLAVEGVDNVAQSSPHFTATFEQLCQHFAIVLTQEPTCLTEIESARLEMLALRKTINGMKAARNLVDRSALQEMRLLSLSNATGAERTSSSLSNVGKSLLHEISHVDQVGLHSLSLLQVELQTIGHAFSAKADLIEQDLLVPLDACLHRLLLTTVSALASANELTALRIHAKNLVQFLRHANIEPLSAIVLEVASPVDPRTASICQRLTRSASYFDVSAKKPTRTEAAFAWTAFATACLDLFLPEHAFDPVQEAQVNTAIYKHTREGLSTRLSAIQSFRQAWLGEQDSLRARLLQEDIDALGSGPDVVEICRPKKSQLSQLHGELRALMRIITPLCQGGSSLEDGAWSNLRVIRTRLSDNYRAYADLTMPVTGFIDCLQIARGLAWSDRTHDHSNFTIAQIVPLIDASLQSWLSESVLIQAQQSCRAKDEQLCWLSVVATRASMIPMGTSSEIYRTTADNAFRQFYEAWKTELTRDQRSNAAKSSLYQYRGGDDDEEEATAAQLSELFPTYDDEAQKTYVNVQIDAQALAPRMAELHHKIYFPYQTSPDDFINLIKEAAQLANVQHSSKLSAVIVTLYDLSNKLNQNASASHAKNIYTDPDIGQSKILMAHIDKVKSRFTSIHQAWPEHATPIDVLRACEQILAISHAEPVARFLPPVEKLHATVNEWQKVASSQYSAASLLEDTTSLIISWRQLELSTWAGLFNHEDKACQTSAASWWYIAYETIVRASADELQTSVSLQSFAQHLVETLASFLSNCGCGEYSLRLSMLGDFHADLATRAIDTPALSVVRDALASLVTFYSHFTGAVGEHMAKKRTELEKQIKEVVQLASWKDRNIETLKHSAKKSHAKLFRIVKKYRVLLAQPVGPLLQNEFPVRKQVVNEKPFAVKDFKALIAQSSGKTGLKDVVANLETQFNGIKALSGASRRIEKFLANLEEESSELRKATPTTATEENKTLIQHLKTRKRRLLADVLRDVRLMGFQTRMSDDALSQQASLHQVLAKTAPLASDTGIIGVDLADYEFHRLLHVMSVVRESTTKPNEDLTPAEIVRSKALLESMLQTVIDQRNLLADNLNELSTVKKTISQLNALAISTKPGVAAVSSSTEELRIKVDSLQTVLQTTLRCAEMQSKLAGRDYEIVREIFNPIMSTLRSITTACSASSLLPAYVDDEALRSAEDEYQAINKTMAEKITECCQMHRELEPVLSQLRNWIHDDISARADVREGTVPAQHWKEDVSKMLSRVCEVTEVTVFEDSLAQDRRAKNAWVVYRQRQLTAALEKVGIQEFSTSLGDLLSQLPHIKTGTDRNFTDITQICNDVVPILEAYADNAEYVLSELCALNSATSKLAHRLSLSFIQLAQKGFCKPSDKSESDEQQSGQVESGTGLGDGEGGEDISKDVGDDEDLGELAQEAPSNEKDENISAEKDAVDMADEDLQGDFDEDAGSEGSQEDGDEEGQDGAELDEETGHVNQDDNAVDEKTWDDGKQGEEAEKEAEKGKGTKNDDMAAAENAEAEEQSEDGEVEEDADAGAQDDAGADHNQPEMADSHIQDEENLELPEDMQMDGDKRSVSDISDIEDDLLDDNGDANAPDDDGAKAEDVDVEMGDGEGEEEQQDANEAVPTEEEEQQASDQDLQDTAEDTAMLDQQDLPEERTDGLVSADDGQGHEEDTTKTSGVASSAEQMENDEGAEQPSDQSGAAEGANKTQAKDNSGQPEASSDDQQSLPFKRLGDVLKQWYNQHRNIEAAQDPQDPGQEEPKDELDMGDPRFEHLPEDAESDMQALGAASVEQSRALDDDNAIDVNQNMPDELPLPEEMAEEAQPELEADQDIDPTGAKGDAADGSSTKNETVIGKPTDLDTQMQEPTHDDQPDNVEDVDEQLTHTHLDQEEESIELMSLEAARQAWAEHENRTRNMAIVLTEHLRLILHPTQATKMRGDFRTGKRLNIKKIIPYIASSYKRDKIWMRRSVPSKRSYQIMLAVDDSESMNENERKGLAFDTLALVAKSMAMLEVGDLSIVGFGQTTNVVHDFSIPFTSDAGTEVVRQLTFTQKKTDVRKLLETSIETFREARLKASGSTSNLWQLQLIISDGLCHDHSAIRQLVRQAHEERIMVVFIVVDAAAKATAAADIPQPHQSILDLQEVEFLKGADGETQVVMKKYMDTFPFRYYLIVRDVLELPSVLAGALRQWFAEVVESDG